MTVGESVPDGLTASPEGRKFPSMSDRRDFLGALGALGVISSGKPDDPLAHPRPNTAPLRAVWTIAKGERGPTISVKVVRTSYALNTGEVRYDEITETILSITHDLDPGEVGRINDAAGY